MNRKFRAAALATTMAVSFFSATALAAGAKTTSSQDRDPYGYYSQQDKVGYYDRDGNYVRFADQKRRNPPPESAPPPSYDQAPIVYEETRYQEQCRKSNNVAGTLFGALAGGLIGGAASHHGGAVVGGVILGGLVGNALTRDMPCEDHPHAMKVYAEGLNGPIGRPYRWSNQDDYGDFVPREEFMRRGYSCRSFTETSYIHGRRYTRSGTACRMDDGNWHFD